MTCFIFSLEKGFLFCTGRCCRCSSTCLWWKHCLLGAWGHWSSCGAWCAWLWLGGWMKISSGSQLDSALLGIAITLFLVGVKLSNSSYQGELNLQGFVACHHSSLPKRTWAYWAAVKLQLWGAVISKGFFLQSFPGCLHFRVLSGQGSPLGLKASARESFSLY